jgi:hypothetical protein
MAKGFVVLLTLGIAVVVLGQTSADVSAKYRQYPKDGSVHQQAPVVASSKPKPWVRDLVLAIFGGRASEKT